MYLHAIAKGNRKTYTKVKNDKKLNAPESVIHLQTNVEYGRILLVLSGGMIMKCNNCNFENKPNAAFCIKCGTKLERIQYSASQQNATEKRTKPPVHSSSNNMKKSKLRAKSLAAVQVLIYLMISSLNMFFMFFQNGVRVKCSYSSKAYKDYSFFSVLLKLVSGGERYNPTVISIVIGVSAILLVFSCAFFWLFTAGTKIFGKFHRESHIITLIISFLNLVCICVSLPLAYRFSGILKLVYAREANFPISEITSIYSVLSFVIAGIILILIILECIVLSAEKKELSKAEAEGK